MSHAISVKKSVSYSLIICETSARMIHGQIMLIGTPGDNIYVFFFNFPLVFGFFLLFLFPATSSTPRLYRIVYKYVATIYNTGHWLMTNSHTHHVQPLLLLLFLYRYRVRLTTNLYYIDKHFWGWTLCCRFSRLISR